MIPVALALSAAAGTFLLYTATVGGQRQLIQRSRLSAASGRSQWHDLKARLGLADVATRDVALASAATGALGALLAFTLFGGALPSVVTGLFAATTPLAALRSRREARRRAAMNAWPRMLEELRILTASVGQSIPQALVTVGRRAPIELRDAFAAAEREWFLSTDFERTIAVLKDRLADPTADAACETLLVAHEVGGVDLDRRLEALVDDRIIDAQGRKDAQAKQAGARFARRFVLIVPMGMALAGMSVGTGRAAYQTATGQVLVAVAIAIVIACWFWAGRMMVVPDERRVFDG